MSSKDLRNTETNFVRRGLLQKFLGWNHVNHDSYFMRKLLIERINLILVFSLDSTNGHDQSPYSTREWKWRQHCIHISRQTNLQWRWPSRLLQGVSVTILVDRICCFRIDSALLRQVIYGTARLGIYFNMSEMFRKKNDGANLSVF